MEMLSEAERRSESSSVPVYDFLYELDSTRGRKRILSSVRLPCAAASSPAWLDVAANEGCISDQMLCERTES